MAASKRPGPVSPCGGDLPFSSCPRTNAMTILLLLEYLAQQSRTFSAGRAHQAPRLSHPKSIVS